MVGSHAHGLASAAPGLALQTTNESSRRGPAQGLRSSLLGVVPGVLTGMLHAMEQALLHLRRQE